MRVFSYLNPLRPTTIQKLLEIIDRVLVYILQCSFATALDSRHKPDWSSEYVRIIDVCMPQCLAVACRPSREDAAT